MILEGGWLIQSPVSDENKEILEQALNGILGSTFEPISVATQVANGVHYIFIAKSTPIVPNPVMKLVKIFVSSTPAGSPPKLDKIEDII